MTFDDLTEGLGAGIVHHLGIYAAVPFEYTEHGLFPCTAASLLGHVDTSEPLAAEKSLVQLNHPKELNLVCRSHATDQDTELLVEAVDGVAVDTGEIGSMLRRYIGTEIPAQFFYLVSAQST